MTHFGQINIAFGWMTIILGIISGSIIGMWSFAGPFKTPPGHTNYTDLPRRMTRLAHIAMFALPMISILYGQHIDLIPVSDTMKMVGSYCWLVCMWGVPSFLILGAIYLPFKYLEVIPVSCGTVALGIISYGYYLLYMGA
ncbi:hypothetical protein [Bdellovibrio sp. HCB337]|uniref:hypothetical protein n=1 Tax=Bdellovibrio sp. HCB337 TaxID=3394358 RepID=UPI0039A5C8D3